MKLITLIFSFFLLTNNLFAQKKTKNTSKPSSIAIEIGVPIVVTQRLDHPIPLNIEYQKTVKKWGFGAALAFEYNQYTYGDCNRRVTLGDPVIFRGLPPTSSFAAYCGHYQYINFKPSVFTNYYFVKQKKWNLFAKIGVIGRFLTASFHNGDYYEFDTNFLPPNQVIHKVINVGPIYLKENHY